MMRRPQWAACSILAAVGCMCCCLGAAAAASSSKYKEAAGAVLYETFEPGWEQRWEYSTMKKYKGRFEAVQPHGFQDPAIQMPEANQHYGMAALLAQPLDPRQGLVVQYEVKLTQGHTCGGAYLKLLSQPPEGQALRLGKLRSKTPFSIMFGPDRCGPDSRVHVILRLNNPALGNATEHHLMSAPAPKDDQQTHVYALVLSADGRYKVLIDGNEEASGKLLSAKFEPPLQPPEIIPDPEHVKPEDWVEEEMMDDPAAVQPEGWDAPRLVPDPDAVKPEGWLEEELPELPDPTAAKPDDWDEAASGVWLPPPVPNPACAEAPGCGPWKPPLVRNKAYKGPWIAPQVKNPEYKGPWKQREIPNPAFFQLSGSVFDLMSPVAAVAFELWTTDSGYTFDSVLLGSGDEGIAAAAGYMRHVWRHRHRAEVAAELAKARAETRPPGLRHWASNLLLDLLEQPVLQGLKPHLGRVVTLLQGQPEMGWAALLLPSTLLLAMLVDRLTAKKAPADIAEDDDDEGQAEQDLQVDEDEAKRLSKHAAQLQKERVASAVVAGAAGPATASAAKKEQQQQPPREQQEAGGGNGVAAEQAGEEAASDEEPDSSVTAQPRRRGAARRA